MTANFGYLVVRRGMPTQVEPAPGQEVETYELLEPLPMRPPRPQVAKFVPWGAHEEAARLAPTIKQFMKSGHCAGVVQCPFLTDPRTVCRTDAKQVD